MEDELRKWDTFKYFEVEILVPVPSNLSAFHKIS